MNTYNDDGTVIESVILCPEEGLYGVDIPKIVWHNGNAWSVEVCSLNVKRGRSCRMRKKAFSAFNDNVNLDANIWI